MIKAGDVLIKLEENRNPEKAVFLKGYFKVKDPSDAEDVFYGITVPVQRAIAKSVWKEMELAETEKLLCHQVHDARLTALFILIHKFEKSKSEEQQKEIVELYLKNIAFVNNWDLIDSSAPKILGPYLLNEDKSLLYEFVVSGNLWKRRISIITTQYFIKKNQLEDTFRLAEILLNDKQDLIHKASGWMLREAGDADITAEIRFLEQYYRKMPRTMLRYAIEKFPEDLRRKFMSQD